MGYRRFPVIRMYIRTNTKSSIIRNFHVNKPVSYRMVSALVKYKYVRIYLQRYIPYNYWRDKKEYWKKKKNFNVGNCSSLLTFRIRPRSMNRFRESSKRSNQYKFSINFFFKRYYRTDTKKWISSCHLFSDDFVIRKTLLYECID